MASDRRPGIDGDAVKRGIERQTATIATRPRDADLARRIGARAARQRRALACLCVLLLAVGILGGYAIAEGRDESSHVTATISPASGRPEVTAAAASALAGPLHHSFDRTVGDVVIRVFESPPSERDGCALAGGVVAELSNGEAVGVGYLPLASSIWVAAGLFGVAEGKPTAWAIVRTDSHPQVRADFGGAHDETTSVLGVAVLAAPLTGGTLSGTVVRETSDESGSSIESVDLATLPPASVACDEAPQDPGLPEPLVTMPGTTRPAVLPDPSGPPPEDPVAAEAAVLRAYRDVYTVANPDEVKRAAAEDWDALAPLREQSKAYGRGLGYSDAQIDGITIDVREVRFLDPTRAAVLFTLTVPGAGSPIADRVGYAVLEDGAWKVARETQCLNLSSANVRCPP